MSQEIKYGGVVTVPMTELSTKKVTLFIVSLLAAVAEIVTTAFTVAPAFGLVNLHDGWRRAGVCNGYRDHR